MFSTLQLLYDNLGKVFAAVVVCGGFIQITPIKINPISWSIKKLSNVLFGDLRDAIKAIDKKLDNHIHDEERRQIEITRQRIIDNAEKLRKGDDDFSDEAWRLIMADIKLYEDYCREHPLFPNNQAQISIKMLNNKYSQIPSR